LLLKYQRRSLGKKRPDSRIILVLAAIVLVIQVLNVLLGVVLSLLAVNEVQALGLGELVDLSTGNTNKELLGELMGDWLACNVLGLQFTLELALQPTLLALSVLEDLEGTEGCGTS
jgi:hypothetical protein